MTTDELEILSTRIADKMIKSTKKWMTPTDLQDECDISVNRQANLRSERKIPFHKRGRYIRYKKSDIDQWLDDAKVV